MVMVTVVAQIVPCWNLFLLKRSTTATTFTANHSHATADDESPFSSFGRLKSHRNKDQRRAFQLEPAIPRGRRRRGGGWDFIPNFPPQTETSTSIDTNFFSLNSFKDIGCSDFIIHSLHKLSFTRPSHVQAMSFAPVIRGKTCVIADQSGSGKTLAYLAPIIQRLRQEELQGLSKSSSQAPRVLVLAPTAELASQVKIKCCLYSHSQFHTCITLLSLSIDCLRCRS